MHCGRAMAFSQGLRSLMLTYNLMDNVGVGCTERVDAGLSMFGVDLVKHCNELGMIVDVSHCGHLTTMDACRHSKKPVNANHTAARTVLAMIGANTKPITISGMVLSPNSAISNG
jgi:membrane dipeptidase